MSVFLCSFVFAQNATQQQQQQQQTRPVTSFDLSDYGVRIEPEPRLIAMMAALDAAGWDPTPKGAEPSVFRQTVRREQSALDPLLRKRMQDFYNLNRLPDAATDAEQAARYVSLAYAIGPAPAFEAPPRSDDLPSGVLEVLDFVPLLREFHRQTNMSERLPRYIRMHQEEANRLRRPAAEMVKNALSYLHTRPELFIVEQIRPAGPRSKDSKNKKDDPEKRLRLTRERERRFHIVPDLLAAPGAINFRIIGDGYYVITPFDANPASTEVRRAYLQFVLDPLALRYVREISSKREEIRTLLEEQRARGANVTPDIFLSFVRSLVAASDARIEASERMRSLQERAAAQLKAAKDDAARAAVTRESQRARALLEDEITARLAEAYERGAVLSFHFAEQLRGIETSGFDLSNFLGDMISNLDLERERRRLSESADAVKRHREARERALKEAEAALASADAESSQARASLIKRLGEAEELLRLRNYLEAEVRLRSLLKEHPEEPRVYFGLAQAASVSAQDAFDPDLQAQRLNLALQLYGDSIRAASPDAHAAIISRAHAARGRILAHLERPAEALKEFDAAIAIGPVNGGAHKEALAERRKLGAQP